MAATDQGQRLPRLGMPVAGGVRLILSLSSSGMLGWNIPVGQGNAAVAQLYLLAAVPRPFARMRRLKQRYGRRKVLP